MKNIKDRKDNKKYDFGYVMLRKYVEKYERKNIEIIKLLIYCSFLFLIPLVFGHASLPIQLIVGTSVNFILLLSAIYIKGWKLILPITIPSISAYLSRIIFGINTTFLLYLIPAIWVGNLIYIYLLKESFLIEGKKYYAIITSSIIKSVWLFSVAIVFVYFSLVPKLFLIAMGPIQLATALGGGLIGIIFFDWRKSS